MIKQIFDKLIIDFQKITRLNGFNIDVKMVTTKSLTLEQLNIANTPAIELFMISNTITPYESINYYTLEVGVLAYLMLERSMGNENRMFDEILKVIEDIENLLKFDLEVYDIDGVEKVYLNQIMPFTNDLDNQGIVFLKFNINYVN